MWLLAPFSAVQIKCYNMFNKTLQRKDRKRETFGWTDAQSFQSLSAPLFKKSRLLEQVCHSPAQQRHNPYVGLWFRQIAIIRTMNTCFSVIMTSSALLSQPLTIQIYCPLELLSHLKLVFKCLNNSVLSLFSGYQTSIF